MRVLVTGVSGFVGGHLARTLLARGHQVSGTVLDEPGQQPPAVATFPLDLAGDPAAAARQMRHALDASGADRVIHLAGLAHVGRSWDRVPAYYRVNLEGTAAVLAAVREAGHGGPVVLASSAEVYGDVPEAEQPIAESRPPAPLSPYSLTKAGAELLVRRDGGIVARSFNMSGPGQGAHFALPAFAQQLAAIAAGEQPPVLSVGNLEARRDFVHVEDGAEALALLAERGEPGAIYNIATGEGRTIREALDLLLAASGLEVEVVLDERYLRPADIALLCGSAEPLRALGWAPRRTLRDAVADLWRWSQAQHEHLDQHGAAPAVEETR